MAAASLALVLLHGAGCDSRAFAPLAPYLDVRPRTPDLPGHGGDNGPPLATIAQMGDWAAGLLTEPCILGGHSMGALAALAVAGHPHVRGLVLLGAAAALPVHPGLLRAARDDPAAARAMILAWGIWQDGPHADAAKSALDDVMAQNSRVLWNDLAACDIGHAGTPGPQSVARPVLVIAGKKDKMTPPGGGAALAAALPRARCHVLEDTGHMMMSENPAGTAAAINEFMKQIQEDARV